MFKQPFVMRFDFIKERLRAPDLRQEPGGRLSQRQLNYLGERAAFSFASCREAKHLARTKCAPTPWSGITGITQGINDDLDRLIQMVQFSAGIGEWLEIKMRRQNLNGDLLDCVVI